MKHQALITFLCSVLLLILGNGQVVSASASQALYFRINKSDIDASYRSNSSAAEGLAAKIGKDSLYNNISRIRVRGTASPDGPLSFNHSVSSQRAQAAVAFIREQFPSLPDYLIEVSVVDEDWGAVASFVKRCSQPWKEEALQIIRSGRADRKEKLQELYVGEAWDYLCRHCFPLLRKAEISVEVDEAGLEPVGNSFIFAQGSAEISASTVGRVFSSLSKDTPITLTAYASPEGKASYNEILAKKRGERVRSILTALGFTKVSVVSGGEDWKGLLQVVSESYSGPHKERLMAILSDSGLSAEARKSEIIALDGGNTWKSMYTKEMSSLRAVSYEFADSAQ